MSIDAKTVAELRERTGCGIKDCKNALAESAGDVTKAIEFLRKKGLASAADKGGRATNAGRVFSYIHSNGQLGVMLELCCETDFVANTEQFQDLGKSLCMHVCATQPVSVNRQSISSAVVEKEKEIYREQVKDQLAGKPQEVQEKILAGKLDKFYKDNTLLEQQYVKNEQITVEEFIKESIATLKENITVRRFVRFQLGSE